MVKMISLFPIVYCWICLSFAILIINPAEIAKFMIVSDNNVIGILILSNM